MICDQPGVLYNFLGVETAGLLNWSFEAQRIIRSAQAKGMRYDRKAPQLLPLTLVVAKRGPSSSPTTARNLTDMPGDCGAIYSLCDEVCEMTRRAQAQDDAPAQPQAKPGPHSDETLTLPDLAGDLSEEEDALSKLFD